jgi:hypothetical protein
MNCTCSDCALSTAASPRLRAWAILVIALAGAFYGAVIAYAPPIARAFGVRL